MKKPTRTTDFTGTDRFKIVRQLGAGGMGVVYEAIDRERNARVALKFLPQTSPSALFAFKQEFRTLADVSHPNLIALYELFSDREQWFFTMELIDGVELQTFILGDGTINLTSSEPLMATATVTQQSIDTHGDTLSEGEPAEADPVASSSSAPGFNLKLLESLRSILRQLAEALREIHSHGWLHRDIKPQNVLVRNDGRVVVLDFGLVSDWLDTGNDSLRIVGTVAYMSPEQAEGKQLTPASDWYSVGAMLYQVLTGRCPFEGRRSQVMSDKRTRDPVPVQNFNPAVPDDLSTLTMSLLSRDPQARPTTADVLRWCGVVDDPEADSPIESGSMIAAPRFVGRREQLAQMTRDFETVRAGRAAVVLVRGESGTGKTALVQHFLDGLPSQLDPVVLAGRCYEQESVPFKAFDSLVDMLTQHLETLSASELAALLPRDVAALGRIFPVMQRLAVIANAPSRAATAPDQVELRRRGFAALREMLTRLGDRHPLILLIDDLQWGDVDSANLFNELLQPPDPPVMLVLGTYRSEDEERSECLRLLATAASGSASMNPSSVIRRIISLSPLSQDEAIELAIGLLDRNDPNALADAEQIVRESNGSPYFLSELAQHVREGIRNNDPGSGTSELRNWPGGQFRNSEVPDPSPVRIRLDDALWRRIERLPEEARQVLDVLATATHPLRLVDALNVARVSDSHAALSRLRNDHFLRAIGSGADEFLAPYHDRIRATITAHQSDAHKRDLHLRLANELQASGGIDLVSLQSHLDSVESFAQSSAALKLDKPQWQGVFDLAYHFDKAGEPARAFPYALAAAEQAQSQYSLETAEQQFRIALVGAELIGQAAKFRAVEGLADVLMLRGKYAETAVQLNQAREIALGQTDRTAANIQITLARIESKLGELSFKRGELKAAKQHIEQALWTLGHPVAPKNRLLLLPLLLFEAARQALHTYFPDTFVGRKKWEHSQTDLFVARLYGRLSYVYWFGSGRIPTLWAHLRELNLAEQYPPTMELAQAYSLHAPAMSTLPNFDRGIRYAQKSLKLREEFGDVWGQGQSLEFYGVVLLAAADYEASLEKSLQGARLLEQTGDFWELNIALYTVALSHYRLGNLREAVEIAQRVYHSGEQLGDIQATAINLAVWALATEGNVPEERMRIEYERERADVQTKVQTIMTKGLWMLGQQRFREAADVFQEALTCAKAAGLENNYVFPNHSFLAHALRRQALELRESSPGQFRETLSRAKSAARRAVKVGRTFPTDLPRSLRELGLIALLEGNRAQAQRLFVESLALAQRHKARYEQALTELAFAQLSQETGQPDANSQMQRAQSAVDAMRDAVSR